MDESGTRFQGKIQGVLVYIVPSWLVMHELIFESGHSAETMDHLFDLERVLTG
jgi:hypothetical protein